MKYRHPREHELPQVTELVSADRLLNKTQKAQSVVIIIVIDLCTSKLKISF